MTHVSKSVRGMMRHIPENVSYRCQTISAALTSCICFWYYATTVVALARDARSRQIPTVYACIQMPFTDSVLFTCPISARRPRCTLIWDHLWHALERWLLIPQTRTKTTGPRGFYFTSFAAWNALQCIICATLNFRWTVSKLNWKLTVFLKSPTCVTWRPPVHISYIHHVIFCSSCVRVNANIHKLARANVCIELKIDLNWKKKSRKYSQEWKKTVEFQQQQKPFG